MSKGRWNERTVKGILEHYRETVHRELHKIRAILLEFSFFFKVLETWDTVDHFLLVFNIIGRHSVSD